jgi:hypothetical protein
MTAPGVEKELVGDLVEVAEAAGGEEGEDEDGCVVADVDERGRHDGAETEADVAEDERDTEEEDQNRPGEGDLLAVEGGEEDAGEDGGEDERGAGESVVGAPLFVGCRGARQRDPVVGDGEGGEEEAAEENLFKERCEQGAKGSDKPDIGRGAEELVHGDVFGQGDEGGDRLDGDGQDQADGDETEGVAACGVEVGLDAVGEGTLPEEREEEPGGGEGGEVAEGLGADQEFRGHAVCGFASDRRQMPDAQKEELNEQKEEAGDSEEESGVAEVGYADGRLGGRGAFGVGEEEGLVFGADGRAEDGYGDGGFF